MASKLGTPSKLGKKDRVLSFLQKLNDRDTQKRAAEDFLVLINVRSKPLLMQAHRTLLPPLLLWFLWASSNLACSASLHFASCRRRNG